MKGREFWLLVVRLLVVSLSAILADGSLGNPVQSAATSLLRGALPNAALGAALGGASAPHLPLGLCVSCWKQQGRSQFALVKPLASGKKLPVHLA